MIVKRYGAGVILFLMIAFLMSGMLLLALREEGQVDMDAVVLGAALSAVILLQYNILRGVFKHIDRFSLLVADFLCIVGIVILYRIDPDTATKQFIWILIGNVLMIVALFVIKRVTNFGKLNYVFIILGIGMLGLTLLTAQVTGGARNWISIAGFTFQPSEFVKVLFLIVTAYFLSVKSRKRDMWPYFLFTIACVGLLVMSRDLGAALLFAGTFLIVFLVGTGSFLITGGAVAAFAVGAYASYKLFPHVRNRVEIWQDPWATYDQPNGGFQIVQGLLAIASGGLLGSGLGLGMPEAVPVVRSDFIFVAIAEEFGIIVGIAIIAMYIIFIVRGILIAMDARTMFDKLLVFGATILLALQSFIIIGGVTKLIPMTGITMPFVSAGGSSMMSSMILLGMIQGVAVKNGENDEAELAEMGGGIE